MSRPNFKLWGRVARLHHSGKTPSEIREIVKTGLSRQRISVMIERISCGREPKETASSGLLSLGKKIVPYLLDPPGECSVNEASAVIKRVTGKDYTPSYVARALRIWSGKE